MGKGIDLLRLLEPVVRPGGAGAPAGTKPTTPIEARSFDSLLEEARQIAATGAAGGEGAAPDGAPAPRPATALTGLGQVDRIENRSLRDLLAARAPLAAPAPAEN